MEIVQAETETLTAKQVRLNSAGATREAGYKALVEGLSAQVMTLDKFGGEHFSPDTSSRIKAGESILRMHGDIRPDTVVDNRVVNISGLPAEAVTGLLHMVKDVADQLRALKGNGQQTGEIIDVNPETT